MRLPGRACKPLLGLLLIATLSGCAAVSSTWNAWFGTPKKPPETLPAPSGRIKASPVWKASLGAPSSVGFVPVIVGETVLAAAQNGAVGRFDLTTGRPLWQVTVGKPLIAGVGTDGALSVVASRDGELIALDPQGQVKWTATVGGEAASPPAVADGVVLLRTIDNRVLAFEADSGKRRWSFQRQNPPLVLRNSGGIAMLPGVGFVGMPGGRMVALALTGGAPRWDVSFAQPKGANELERIADVVGSPLVIGREVCAVTYQGRIGCLDVVTGAPIWTKEFSSASGFDVDNRGLIAPDAEDTVHAFDRRGTPLWTTRGFARHRLSAPFIAGNVVVLGNTLGNLLWLSRDDGVLAAVSPTDGKPIVAPAAGAGPMLVVQTSGGTLHAFRID